MTEAEARTSLEWKVAYDVEPVLAVEVIDTLLALSKRPDAEGLLPSEEGWGPTWDLDAAAAAGWEIKAGRAVAFDFGEDGQRFNRSQVHDQCVRMARFYRRGTASTRVRSGALDDYTAAVLEGTVVE